MRALDNWIDRYLEYYEETESARPFVRWTAMSLISAVLRKKVHLSLGRIKIYPNLYVVFVAPPGMARKSQAIDFGLKILREIKGIHLSADSITREALIQDLEGCKDGSPLPNGGTMEHASMSIISKEFESFLGHKTDNTKMLVLLTDLFDSSDEPWRYRTKQSGSNEIPPVYLNLLGATTPDSLAQQLPASAIGGGLTSRILFIWGTGKYKKCAIPVESQELRSLKDKLVVDLDRISNLAGTFLFTTEAKDYWVNWYNEYEELDPRRLCLDSSFDGWYSRKPMYILKIAQVVSAAETSTLDVTVSHLERAIKEIESVELDMGRAFKAVGRSDITSDVAIIVEIVKTYGLISEKKLLGMVWRDIDAKKFDNVINTALKSGKIKRDYKQSKEEIYYAFMED